MDFLDYCKNLKPEDWEVIATSKWTVKEVVAHLVGWEKEAVKTFKESWTSGVKPWFMVTDDYEDFNTKVIEEYKSFSPEELLTEWKKWQDELDRLVKEVGEEKVNARYKEFGWVMDLGEESHYDHHLKQIKKALER